MNTPTTQERKQAMEDAWKEVENTTRPAHMVRNCDADARRELEALERWQVARRKWLDSAKLDAQETPCE